jgi:hypothetical protein
MIAVTANQQVFAKKVPFTNNILASESPIILYFNVALDDNVETRVFETIEFHLIELKDVALDDIGNLVLISFFIDHEFLLSISELLSIDEPFVDFL